MMVYRTRRQWAAIWMKLKGNYRTRAGHGTYGYRAMIEGSEDQMARFRQRAAMAVEAERNAGIKPYKALNVVFIEGFDPLSQKYRERASKFYDEANRHWGIEDVMDVFNEKPGLSAQEVQVRDELMSRFAQELQRVVDSRLPLSDEDHALVVTTLDNLTKQRSMHDWISRRKHG